MKIGQAKIHNYCVDCGPTGPYKLMPLKLYNIFEHPISEIIIYSQKGIVVFFFVNPCVKFFCEILIYIIYKYVYAYYIASENLSRKEIHNIVENFFWGISLSKHKCTWIPLCSPVYDI